MSWSPPEPRTAPTAVDDRSRAVLAGLPASGGTCFGSARVVRTPAGVAAVRPGEICVVPALSAGLMALLTHAGAVVAERGGTLSNAATLARELRIPVVVAARDATQLIATGDQLLVDGTSGAIRRFPQPR